MDIYAIIGEFVKQHVSDRHMVTASATVCGVYHTSSDGMQSQGVCWIYPDEDRIVGCYPEMPADSRVVVFDMADPEVFDRMAAFIKEGDSGCTACERS